LRLEYYSLKKRIEQQSAVTVDSSKKAVDRRRSTIPLDARSVPAFLELAPAADRGECTVELEDASGAKMRVHLMGVPMPDLAALSRSFWNPAS
jgi:hypothetical protein